jgi:hypothetical protein
MRQRLDLLRVRYIAGKGHGFISIGAQFSRYLLDLLLGPRCQDNLCSFVCEERGDGFSQPAAGPGDNRDLIFKGFHIFSIFI